jgi:replicative DNA helicase
MYWDHVWNVNCPADDYELLRDNINNRYVQWQAYEILRNKLDTVVKSTTNQCEVVRDIRESFHKIDNLDADPYALTMDMKEGMARVVEHIKDRRENPDTSTAILTGINGIDRIYHGFNRGSYTLISGQINGGKTTLMFNIGFNMAKAGYGVVYVSLEKEAVPFFTRLLALHALVDYNRIKVGGTGEYGLNDYYYNKLIEAADQIQNQIQPKMVCIQLAQGTKVSKVISEIERVKARMKVDVLVVDYLGVIGAEIHHVGRPDLDEYKVSQRIQSFGRVNRFVTITATQLKTPSAKEIRGKSKKATIDDPSKVEINTEDMSGSKMIPADADNALGIAMNGDKPPTKAYVFGTKARDDEARHIITLDFDGKIGRICDPILESGQVTAVDQIIYNTNITEKELDSDDGLFDGVEKATTTTTTSEPKAKPEIVPPEVKEVLDAMEEPSNTSEPSNEEIVDENLPIPGKDDNDVWEIG